MELPNSAADCCKSQPIQESEADVGASMTVGGQLEVAGTPDGGDGVDVDSGSTAGGAEMVKKKRGRPPRVQAKSPPAKINKEEDEDVCFICFDGGSLVLCDRRGCPKAYHPACVKRDEAFFRSKAKWNCGWHICSICQKAAHHMCYTCTYSLCKGCIKKADYVCVRGDKGFCTVCMKTIMLIENNGQGKDEKAHVDFDDKTSWEYLFKVYWIYLKGKLSLTLDELTQAKNPWKEATTIISDSPATCVHNGVNERKSIMADTSVRNLEASESKRRKTDEKISIPPKETVSTKKLGTDESSSVATACNEWATKELLDFVAHMKNGNTSVLSQFDVQELMLEYIKRNNLRDPRKKSQIVCDSRLKILFGKPRVGHFEMLKLLEFHFFIKEDLPKNPINSVAKQVDPDWNSDNMMRGGKDKKRRSHRKGEERAPQNKLDEYAAIDVHNMNLVYLRRKLMENLIDNREEFHGKVVGSIVRIRISGSDQKHDMYRLVQVVGTTKADAPYKIGDKSADVVLEVLNLDKKETVSIDTISNQDLSEDECRRLRQSIRCGLVKRFTVGEIQDKAVSLQSVRLNDWMEAETLRLNNLRDRASEKGHKKGLREYVEKLQLLKTPEERERRLREIPEVHSDPKMNPDYETDDTEEYFNKEHGEPTKLKHSGISRKNTNSLNKRTEFSNNGGSRSRKNEQHRQVNIANEEGSTKPLRRINITKDGHMLSSSGRPQNHVDCNGSTSTSWNQRTTGSSTLLNTASEATTSSYSMRNTPTSNDSEMDKVWHYRDPSGKIQGPFCMVQLQKWSTTGYFPVDMRIWRNREDESLLLNDVLKEQLHNSRLSENKTTTDKVGIRIEGLTVRTANPLSTVHVTSQTSVNPEILTDSHGSSGQPSLHNWSTNGNNLNPNPPSIAKLNESSRQFNTPDLATPTPVDTNADTKHGSSVFDIANAGLEDLPSPTPKMSHEHEKVQNAGDKDPSVQDTRNPTSWTNASTKDVGGAQLSKTADEWSGYSPTQVKHEEWNSERVTASEVDGDHVATTASNIEQIIPTSSPPLSQPAYSYLPPWQGVRETIEFSTLAEESVSDLLAEVDAMESQNGFPSPTSRRNSFVEDLFNGSFEEFSPTPDQGARSDGFSSSGADIQLPFQSTTTATITTTISIDEHAVGTSQVNNTNVFDFVKSSTDLQKPYSCPETKTENMPFKWPEMPQETISKDIQAGSRSSELQPVQQDMIDVNNSTTEANEGERETKINYGQVQEQVAQIRPDNNASETSHDRTGVLSEHKEYECAQPTTTTSKDGSPELALQVSQNTTAYSEAAKVDTAGAGRNPGDGVRAEKEGNGGFIPMEATGPPPPLSLAIGLDKVYPQRVGSEAMQGNFNNSGRPAQEVTTRVNPHLNINRSGWERTYGGERYNNNSPRERSYKVEELGYSRTSKSWGRQPSFGSGSGGGGGYSRPPPKGQRVCKFYESGRCKKGASCNYWHP